MTNSDRRAGFELGCRLTREMIAAHVMCGCDTAQQAAVMAAATTDGPNSAARWRACHRTDCLALLAAEILDLPPPDPDLVSRTEQPDGK